MAFLELNHVSKKLSSDNYAVKELSLSVKQHAKLGIVGETGSGKSTLLRLIGGLQQKDTGTIHFEDKKVKGPEDQLIPGHPEMQYLSQYFELKEFMTVAEYLDNIYLIAEDDADKIYKACQIEHLLSKDTRHLSGGEKQRVAMAKALTHQPRLLLLDEPFSNLDFHHKKIIKTVIENVGEELDTTIIMITHEPKDVLSWADEIVVMRKGEVVQKGTPKELYEKPKNEYVAGLFGKYQLLSAEKWGIGNSDEFHTIKGNALVRPEQFVVSRRGAGIRGTVTKVLYHGSYDEVTIETTAGVINLTSQVRIYSADDQVVVKLIKE